MGASFLRTVVMYLALIAVLRLMGKRQVGQMEPSELVVAMLIADLASIPMQNLQAPIYHGMIPIVTVLALELLLSWLALRSIRLRRLLCGKPVILIENGKLLQKNLRATRITLDELTGLLREKEVLELRTVQYAILETGGNLSVFLFPGNRPATAKEAGIQAKKELLPVTVVSDGVVLKENLQKAGKDLAWLEKVLAQKQARLQDTLLLTVDPSDKLVFYKKE